MIKDFELCRVMSKIAQSNNLGQFIAVYNDFEQKWSLVNGMLNQQSLSNESVDCKIQRIARIALILITEQGYRDWETDRKSTRLNSSHSAKSRMPSSA